MPSSSLITNITDSQVRPPLFVEAEISIIRSSQLPIVVGALIRIIGIITSLLFTSTLETVVITLTALLQIIPSQIVFNLLLILPLLIKYSILSFTRILLESSMFAEGFILIEISSIQLQIDSVLPLNDSNSSQANITFDSPLFVLESNLSIT